MGAKERKRRETERKRERKLDTNVQLYDIKTEANGRKPDVRAASNGLAFRDVA